mgnify:CR=1 FL=1
MISHQKIIEIHKILIDKYGGVHGVKDFSLLDSALHRPFATFDTKELYPTPIEKAAALLQSIVNNHPFNDGNKRIGYFLCRSLLREYGFDLKAGEDKKYQLVIAVTNGIFSFEEICNWLKNNSSVIQI